MFPIVSLLKAWYFAEQVSVSQWLRSSCARPSFGHSSSRLVKKCTPGKICHKLFVGFGWGLHNPIRHLMSPSPNSIWWVNVLSSYANNNVWSMLLCTFTYICFCRSCLEKRPEIQVSKFWRCLTWCKDREDLGFITGWQCLGNVTYAQLQGSSNFCKKS